MKVIIDTNILLISLPKNSKYRPIFDALKNGLFELGLSSEILLEYEEILADRTSPSVAVNVIKLLINLETVTNQTIHFNWGLITVDEDDNKYVDCAIAFNANYLVTEDKHFNILTRIDYPKVNIIGADVFLEIIENL